MMSSMNDAEDTLTIRRATKGVKTILPAVFSPPFGWTDTANSTQSASSMGQPKTIQFYKVSDPFGEFSNFTGFPYELKGVIWATSEHYFQAQKFAGTEHEETVRLIPSPMAVAKKGRNRSLPLRADWEAVKDDIMREAVRAKFAQHPALASLLLSTGNAELVEHTTNDNYWGDGGDGSGRNMLGKILVEIRNELRGKS